LRSIPEIEDSNFAPKPSTLTDDPIIFLSTSKEVTSCIAVNTRTSVNPHNEACDYVIFLTTIGLKSLEPPCVFLCTIFLAQTLHFNGVVRPEYDTLKLELVHDVTLS